MGKKIAEIENSSKRQQKPLAQIKKRDGLDDFNNSKISYAIYKDVRIISYIFNPVRLLSASYSTSVGVWQK